MSFGGAGNKINKFWRVLGTGFGFTSLGLGGLLLCLTAFPFVILATRDLAKRRRRVRQIIGHTFAFYLGVLKFLGVLDLKVSNISPFMSVKGCLIICNHPTLLDVVIIMSQMKDLQCVVKAALWQNPFIGGVIRSAGYIRNDLPPETFLEECKAQLERGENILIFPEGTRTQPNKPLEMHRGMGNLALGANADIQALVMTCNPLTLTKGNPWYNVPHRKPFFHLTGGRTFYIGDYPEEKPRSLRVRALMRDIKDFYIRQLDNE